MKLFKRREWTQDEHCVKANQGSVWHDHAWGKWHWWMRDLVSERTCSNCGGIRAPIEVS